MTTWRIDLQYDGTAFKGWARQPGLRTVQAEVERALSTALRSVVRVRVAGRTDAGVHAWGQVASFVAPVALDAHRLLLGLSALLPDDVAVQALTPVPDGFDARAARSRTYRYTLWCGTPRPVRERAYVWHVRGALDESALAAAARLFCGRRDWAACTPSARLYRTCEREVLAARWLPAPTQPAGPVRRLVFEITATGFLHNMVRVAVGSMVDVAQGRLGLDEVEAALAAGERRLMGQTAPARGLALVRVEY
jgi:tRNA pseudouridine38-40 synthase